MFFKKLFKKLKPTRQKLDSRINPDSNGRELGLDFYLFTGGITNNTLPFCKKKNGKYFHFKEVMDFVEEDWDGKDKNTTEKNIFKLIGGSCNRGDFSEKCDHALMPISEAVVPKKVLIRNIEKGYYNPPKFIRDELGLKPNNLNAPNSNASTLKPR